jgi:hemoglobin-like flavoprotein
MALEPRRLHELRDEATRAGRDTVFDPVTVQRVRDSCARLPEDRVELTRVFYDQLFAMAPSTRSMFAEDMSEQHDRLLSALLAAVRALDRPEVVEDHLRRWGVVHRRMHGVTDEMYVYVGHALVRAIHKILGHLETSVASSWIAVYEWMAAVMIDGAAKADLIDRDPSKLLGQPQFYPASAEQPQVTQDQPVSNVLPFRRAHGAA